jgi:hypothetical protein
VTPPRPLAATVFPVALLAASLVGALAFDRRQESSGRTSLHEVATTFARERSRAPGAQVALREVSVVGGRGVATFALPAGPFEDRSIRLVWQRTPEGGWEGPTPLEEPVSPRPTPVRRR